MKGAYLIKPHSMQIKNVEMPEPKSGEVRVYLQKSGICGSDIHFFSGHRLLEKPTIIGHEGMGIIDKTGTGVTLLKAGDRVVIEPNIPCHQCSFCLSGKGNICINKRVLGVSENGCFAEYITVPAPFCWLIPPEISDEDAVTIEPMAVSYHALFSSACKPGDNIVVIGLGAIGLLLTHLALKLGFKVWTVEINEAKRKLAEGMGAYAVIVNGSLEEQSKDLNKICSIENITAIFECAGSEFTASLAAIAAPRGAEIILLGLSEKMAVFQPLKITREGIRIIPSIIYDHPMDFKRTIQLIQTKIIAPGFIVSDYYNLQQIQKALETATASQQAKIVVNIAN